MTYNRVLTIQDISCFGQCSLTVALPIISACGVETCVIPSAVLSTHTGNFKGYTFRDLTEDIPAIQAHWIKEGIKFDAIYTGYLGNIKQIAYVNDIMRTMGKTGCKNIVDPAMADNGKLYSGFNMEFVEEMKSLCKTADIILPNITEACLLTNTAFRTQYDEEYIISLMQKLHSFGPETIILTGVSYQPETTGIAVLEKGTLSYYEHQHIQRGCHGTGDVYASAFVGMLMNGHDTYTAASFAADFTVTCIENTQGDSSHWYGVKFETALPQLINKIAKNKKNI